MEVYGLVGGLLLLLIFGLGMLLREMGVGVELNCGVRLLGNGVMRLSGRGMLCFWNVSPPLRDFKRSDDPGDTITASRDIPILSSS